MVYAPSPDALKLCQFAREFVEEAFHPLNPLTLHETVPVEQCVETLAKLKPKFIHHPKSKEYIQGMLAESGCDLEKTYFDVPRLRTAFPGDYFKSGIGWKLVVVNNGSTQETSHQTYSIRESPAPDTRT